MLPSYLCRGNYNATGWVRTVSTVLIRPLHALSIPAPQSESFHERVFGRQRTAMPIKKQPNKIKKELGTIRYLMINLSKYRSSR